MRDLSTAWCQIVIGSEGCRLFHDDLALVVELAFVPVCTVEKCGWPVVGSMATVGASAFQCVRRLSRRVFECLCLGFGMAFYHDMRCTQFRLMPFNLSQRGSVPGSSSC